MLTLAQRSNTNKLLHYYYIAKYNLMHMADCSVMAL